MRKSINQPSLGAEDQPELKSSVELKSERENGECESITWYPHAVCVSLKVFNRGECAKGGCSLLTGWKLRQKVKPLLGSIVFVGGKGQLLVDPRWSTRHPSGTIPFTSPMQQAWRAPHGPRLNLKTWSTLLTTLHFPLTSPTMVWFRSGAIELWNSHHYYGWLGQRTTTTSKQLKSSLTSTWWAPNGPRILCNYDYR